MIVIATVINNAGEGRSSNNAGLIIGLVLALAILYFLFVYGIPAISNLSQPQVNVPDKVDINVQQPTQ